MIQFKRGSSRAEENGKIVNNWDGVTLADGQPGYDKSTNRLKVGDGISKWSVLKSIGLSKEQILDSNATAADRIKKDPEDFTVFTYGTMDPDDPDNPIIGDVYLHQYAGKPEADFVIETGKSSIWTFRKWNHGISECWGTFYLEARVDQEWGNSNIFYSSLTDPIRYPEKLFKSAPVELATVNPVDADFAVWLGGRTQNSEANTARYYIFKANSAYSDTKNFYIQIHAIGRWKE